MPSARIPGKGPHRRSDEGDFHVQTFSLEYRGAAGAEGASAPLLHAQNAHSSGDAAQALEESVLLQEYGDVAKTEVFGGRKLVRRDGIQFDREGGV